MTGHLTVFHKKLIKNGVIMEVITGAYELDFKTSRVRVAGVKYTRKNPRDHWTRRVQSNYAIQRLAEAPFILQFAGSIKSLHHYNYRRLEKFMRAFFTLNGLTEKNPDTIHRFGQVIHDQIFRPELTPPEVQSYQSHIQKLKDRGLPIYSTNYLASQALKSSQSSQSSFPPTYPYNGSNFQSTSTLKLIDKYYVSKSDYFRDTVQNNERWCSMWMLVFLMAMIFTVKINYLHNLMLNQTDICYDPYQAFNS